MVKASGKLITLALVLAAAAGCTDLTVPPKSTVTTANIFSDTNAYKQYLAKLYVGLTVTGQAGPAGNGDIQGIDEGFSSYLRQYWQLEELPTDEAIIAWGDLGLPDLNTQTWSDANPFVSAMYARIYFQVQLANEFLRETTDAKLASRGVSAGLKAQIQTYRAEARFLRALSYWHGLDLFGNIPLVTEDTPLGSTPPKQATRQDIFNYIESELKAIRTQLPPSGDPAYYGRANVAAADMLLAKLYMNAGVYTGADRYADALAAVTNVISECNCSLDPDYHHLFQADNNTSPEIIFAIPEDGLHTQTYGGMTYIIHAEVGGNMNPSAFGIDGGWWGLRTKPSIVALYPAGDGRALFFTNGQTLDVTNTTDFTKGYALTKYQNVTSTGQPGSNPAFSDADFPMFRLGDAYLMYAEAVLRGGGGSAAQALTYVNALRQRAFGNTSGNITAAQLTLPFILDERARELLWEGHRRTDLIRFGQFTTNDVWEWKGGTFAGSTTPAYLALYPIPARELAANPNLKQNTGYGQ